MPKVSKKVSKTSGQNITRGSYQKARALVPHKPPALPKPAISGVSTPATGGGGRASGMRDYGKAGPSGSYTEREMRNPNLESLKNFLGGPAPKRPKGF